MHIISAVGQVGRLSLDESVVYQVWSCVVYQTSELVVYQIQSSVVSNGYILLRDSGFHFHS